MPGLFSLFRLVYAPRGRFFLFLAQRCASATAEQVFPSYYTSEELLRLRPPLLFDRLQCTQLFVDSPGFGLLFFKRVRHYVFS